MNAWFVEPDADNEPTLWLYREGHEPLVVLRRCDLPEPARHLWPLVPQAA